MQRMTATRILYWALRLLVLLHAGFISLFALEVFSDGFSLWETVVALTMHLIPTALLLLALAIAWHWEGAGAVLYLALGLVRLLQFGPEGEWLA